MKKILIVAHTGIGANRVKVGEEEIVVPTTFAEVKSGKFGDDWTEERAMARAIASKKIEHQRGMRPGGGLDEEEKALLAEFRAKRKAKTAGAKKAPKVRNRTRETREAAAASTETASS